jgi:hypothetical protein
MTGQDGLHDEAMGRIMSRSSVKIGLIGFDKQ